MKKIVKSKKTNASEKKHHGKNFILSVIMIILISIASLVLVFSFYIIITSPDFDKELLYSKESSVIYDINGEELARIGVDNRKLVTYDQLPQVLVDALVATEDSRFFQHNGVDGARFMKASFGQLLGKKDSGGASTLTMQVVKNTYTGKQSKGIKGIVRKFKDIYMAVFKIESSYTKEEIIEFYVNSQWFTPGNLNYESISGIEQACEYYFGKSVSDLTLAEASVMAGMFQNPILYNPYKNPENAKKRQDTVLTLMVRHGYITKEEKEIAQKIPIQSLLKADNQTSTNMYQADIDYIVQEVTNKTKVNPYQTAMQIYSTIDPKVQSVLYSLENGEIYKFPNDYLQEGIAITSVENGSIVALSGGRNYQAKGLNRATDIKRQPGSTAKVIFDYGPYIEYLNGSTYTPLLDEQTTYSNGTPIKNADGTYYGLMTMRNALINSRNIPALRAFKAVENDNIENIKNFAHSLGIDYGKDLYESASIGGFDGVSPLQMSAAYAAFARGGYYIEPYSVTKVIYENGEEENFKYSQERVMSEETAYMVTDMLVSTAKSGVGGVTISGADIGAKSGTTTIDKAKISDLNIPASSIRDSWNITFSCKYATALWLGYDRTTKEHYLTIALANPARKAVMKAVGTRIYSKSDGKFGKPSGVIESQVELETFPPQLPSENTPSNLIITELFKEGTEPTEVSTRFSQLNNVTNAKAEVKNNIINISWNAIDTPDAINNNYLSNFFNEHYEESASKYYEKRLNYNSSYIGTLEYQIYLDNNGSLTLLGSTASTSYSYTAPNNGEYKLVIKSAYTIFKSNMSSGTSVSATVSNNISPITPGDPTLPEQPDNNENNDL